MSCSVAGTLAGLGVLAQIASPLLNGAALRSATIGSVLLLAAAAVVHAGQRWGQRAAGVLLLVAAGIGLAAEVVGVHTGLPFGRYHYSGALGPQLAGVPLLVPLAWTMLAYPALLLGRRLSTYLALLPGRRLSAAPALTLGRRLSTHPALLPGRRLSAAPALTLGRRLSTHPALLLCRRLSTYPALLLGRRLSAAPALTLGRRLSAYPAALLLDRRSSPGSTTPPTMARTTATTGFAGPQRLATPARDPFLVIMKLVTSPRALSRKPSLSPATARSRWRTALLGGTALAGWDLFLDPQMVARGYWHWAHPSPALPGVPTVPLSNYAGWLLVSVLMVAALDVALDAVPPATPAADARLDARAELVPAAVLFWTWLGSIVGNLAFFGRPWVALWGGLAMGAVVLPYLLLISRSVAGRSGSTPTGLKLAP